MKNWIRISRECRKKDWDMKINIKMNRNLMWCRVNPNSKIRYRSCHSDTINWPVNSRMRLWEKIKSKIWKSSYNNKGSYTRHYRLTKISRSRVCRTSFWVREKFSKIQMTCKKAKHTMITIVSSKGTQIWSDGKMSRSLTRTRR